MVTGALYACFVDNCAYPMTPRSCPVRILFATWDGGGTVPAEMGVVRQLRAAGHQVTVIGDITMKPSVLDAGARFRPWERAPQRLSPDAAGDLLKDWEVAGNPVKLFHRLLDRLVTGPAALFAEDVRAAVASQRCDAILVDSAILGALVAAQSLGLPHAAVHVGIYARPTPGTPPFGMGLAPGHGPLGRLRDHVLPRVMNRVWNYGLPALNAARAAYALPALSSVWEQYDLADRVLILTSPAFDFPVRLPANTVYVGPVLDDPQWVGAPIDLPPGDQPLVTVGLSSARTKGADCLRDKVVEALLLTDLRAVVTTGPVLEPIESGADRIQVLATAPHAQLLPRSTAVVTHGGHGTVTKALAAGRPTMVIPLGRDQGDNAARVVAAGAGLRLSMKDSPTRIAENLRHLVTDPDMAAAADRLGREMRRDANCGSLVTEVNTLTH